MHILIIRLSALGDIVHCLPAAAYIRKFAPGCSIAWLVEPAGAPLVVDNPVVDEVIEFPRKRWLADLKNPLRWIGTARDIASFRSGLVRREFDLVVDFQGLLKSAVPAYVSGAKRRLGFAGTREGAPALMTDKVDVGNYFGFDTHVVDLNLKLARRACELLGCFDLPPIDEFQVEFPLPSPGDQRAAKVKELLPQGSGPVVVLIPGTTWETKIWAPSRWSELGAGLAGDKDQPCRVVIAGGGAESATNAGIESGIRSAAANSPVCNLTGKTDLLDLVALFSISDVVVGGDTGPLHLAAAVGKPEIVGVYGSTPVGRNGPYGPLSTTVTLDLECQPCYEKKCPLATIACLVDLPSSRVYAAVRDAIIRAGRRI